MKQAFGLSIPEQLRELCTPERAALIIYDMQAGIVPQISNGREIVSGCQQILAAARKAGIRIFFTRHLFLPNRIAGVGQLRRAMIWQRKSDPAETKPLFTWGSPSWQIVPELSPQEDEAVIDKITMSAFEGTYLDLAMRDAQLQVFIIAGIALEVGIEPTVRHGLDLNYIPIVVSDLCGSKTEEVKRRSLETLEDTGEVIQVKAAEILDFLKR
ncbi:MAG TPA: cysteine hydrolase [Acidobacteriaceae bacterium]|jgi:nicotinamidase-related amidase|nr:cysteine hydrolase [Acidobacteriaceae bacterium]